MLLPNERSSDILATFSQTDDHATLYPSNYANFNYLNWVGATELAAPNYSLHARKQSTNRTWGREPVGKFPNLPIFLPMGVDGSTDIQTSNQQVGARGHRHD